MEISLRTATEFDSQSEEAKVYDSNGRSEHIKPPLCLQHLESKPSFLLPAKPPICKPVIVSQ